VRYCRNVPAERSVDVRGVCPVTVMDDGPEYVAVHLSGGTEVMKPMLADGAAIRSLPLDQRFVAERTVAATTWAGEGIVQLYPREGAHSVWIFWQDDGSFWGWYVNLEARHHRWSGGIDTRDHILDLWISADGEPWWKDEDEFEWFIEAGRISSTEADEIRAEGEAVLERYRRRLPPFDAGWETRPRPRRNPLPLPDDWARPVPSAGAGRS